MEVFKHFRLVRRILSCWAASVARPYLSTGCFLHSAASLGDRPADLCFVLTEATPHQRTWSLVSPRICIKPERKEDSMKKILY